METLLKTKETIIKINGYFKNSVQNIIAIGTELNNVKTVKNNCIGKDKIPAQIEYLAMYNELGFGTSVGDKFIKISQDKYIAQFIENMPSSYNTLYTLSGETENTFMMLIELKLNPASTGLEVKSMLETVKGSKTKKNTKSKDGSTTTKDTSPTVEDTKDTSPTVEDAKDTSPTVEDAKDAPDTGGAETPNDDTSKTEDKNTSTATDNVSLIGDGTTALVDMVKVVSIEINKDLISGNDAVITELSNLQNKMFELIKGVSAKVEMKTPDLTVLKVGVKVPMKNAA